VRVCLKTKTKNSHTNPKITTKKSVRFSVDWFQNCKGRGWCSNLLLFCILMEKSNQLSNLLPFLYFSLVVNLWKHMS
jgi:hypothetical protein